MTDRAREWPLAAFTLALQCSCGLALAAAFTEWKGTESAIAQARPLGVAVFPVVAAGLFTSLLHVGRPRSAGRALTNLAPSRLSQEILLTALFAIAALVYSALWFSAAGGMPPLIGRVTSALGVLAVAFSARIYALPARPFWHAAWLPLSFVGTTSLLGGLAGAIVAGAGLLPWFRGAVGAGALLLLFSALWMLARWGRLRRLQTADPQLESWPPQRTSSRTWIAFGLCVLLAGAVPILWCLAGASGAPVAFGVAAFGFVLLGTMAGRMLMFSLPESIARF